MRTAARFLLNLALAPIALTLFLAMISWPFAGGQVGFFTVWRDLSLAMVKLSFQTGATGSIMTLVAMAALATVFSAWRDRRRVRTTNRSD